MDRHLEHLKAQELRILERLALLDSPQQPVPPPPAEPTRALDFNEILAEMRTAVYGNDKPPPKPDDDPVIHRLIVLRPEQLQPQTRAMLTEGRRAISCSCGGMGLSMGPDWKGDYAWEVHVAQVFGKPAPPELKDEPNPRLKLLRQREKRIQETLASFTRTSPAELKRLRRRQKNLEKKLRSIGGN